MTATPVKAGLVVGTSNVQADDGHEQLAVTNPANQEVIGYAPVADAGLVDEAVRLAAQAFPKWSTTPAPQRSSHLVAIASWVRDNRDRLARTLTLEQGKPRSEAAGRGRCRRQGVRLLRRGSGADSRRDDLDRVADPPQRRDQAAHRGDSGDRHLELPARDHGVEDRARARCRLHRGGQARRADPAHRAGRHRGRGERGPAARRAQLGQRGRRHRGRQPCLASAGAEDHLHRAAPRPAAGCCTWPPTTSRA